MYIRYKQRVPRRELAFDSPSAREGHSLRNAQEFYAEGYNVFHGPHVEPQARLRHFAPELYTLLRSEALANHLPMPDEAALDVAARELGLAESP
jgi:hypothetical protein